ncbi:hypothetical protein M0805_009081 [Coniferiporia weirii]|nr:hypothetical protein M0805_009081 [Coniferiporia weirii]
MPPPPTTTAPTSGRARPDAMKNSILRESTAGWANAITPLRIAKRDQVGGASSSSSSSPAPAATRVVARRSSNSYKHMFNNNLVSRSPFKSQIPAPTRNSPRLPTTVAGGAGVAAGSPRTTRKVSGEKRPRPDSLIQQAERENAQRVTELGFKRRQSRGFQGLVEKEPVSKSPFRVMTSNDLGTDDDGDDEMAAPISIELPMKHLHDVNEDSTSPETTETESSLNSKENVYVSQPTVKAINSPARPLTPPQRPVQQHFTPSPSFERRSPIPSALQASPARSSLVQKPRLMGPRSRSLSTGGSPADTPTRERRKTVTFDERCDVVEFDRESHEDAVFETDDEEVYGAPEQHRTANSDSSADSSNVSAEYATAEYTTPTHSPHRIMPMFDAAALDDSINGLVDSMLQEASTFNGEPSTPEAHSNSFTAVVADLDMMAGGAEGGVPHGRTHHAERARAHQHEIDAQLDSQLPLPGVFANQREDVTFGDMGDNEPFFSPTSLSTPPAAAPQNYGRTPLPALPPDMERAEDGMPLGRTHHSDRARAARDTEVDVDMKILPPSPSPTKGSTQTTGERELSDMPVPKFDLGLNGFRTSSPRGAGTDRSFTNNDVFGPPSGPRDLLAELEFEHPDIDADVLSNTSIASFHEFPSFDFSGNGYDRGEDKHEHEWHDVERSRDRSERSIDVSFGGHSNRSLDASVANIVNDLKTSHEQKIPEQTIDEEYRGAEASSSNATKSQAGWVESVAQELPREQEARGEAMFAGLASSSHVQNRNLDSGLSPPQSEMYGLAEGQASQASLTGSDSGRNRGLWINKEEVRRRLIKQRSAESFSLVGTPPHESNVEGMDIDEEAARTTRAEKETKAEGVKELKTSPLPQLPSPPSAHRPTLEERLKRALSPTPAPVRPSLLPSAPFVPTSSISVSPNPIPAPVPVSAQGTHIPNPRTSLTPSRPDLEPRGHTFAFGSHSPASAPLSASFDFSQPGVDIAEMDMRSALDRLVDDVSVAGGGERVNNGISTRADRSGATISSGDVSMADTELITEESTELLANLHESLRGHDKSGPSFPTPQRMQRASTAPDPLTPTSPLMPRPRTGSEASRAGMIGVTSRDADAKEQKGKGKERVEAPPLPPKTPEKSARLAREEMIREKRRQARARESGEYFIPPRRDASGNLLEESPASRRKSLGRPSPRRSLSANDIEDESSDEALGQRRVSLLKNQRGGVLGMTLDDVEPPLTDSIERELNKIADPEKKKSYELREREAVVYASSSQDDSLLHLNQTGEADADRAWRTVRRPSDMNEYARQIREYRLQENPVRAHGRVFVKVVRINAMSIPLPHQHTMFSCTLNNGIHFVTTPECRLTRDAIIEQEFELIEHTKLEFTLTIKVRRDPHIVQQFKAITPPAPVPPPPAPVASSSHRSAVRSFFGGSPKKPKPPKHVRAQTEPIVRFVMEENLARYLKPDGTLARAFIAFKDIAPHCDARLFETALPLIGQRLEAPGEGGGAGGTTVPRQIGEIVLQVFRLPPIHGIPLNELPQSAEECHRGLRNIKWHKTVYHEGVLTQLGADCSTWRRRHLRIVGGSIIAFNDITKRPTITIELKRALSIEDDQGPSVRRRDVDDFDGTYGVERSFRLIFPHNEEITFFADTDEEKAKWLEVLHALVGHIPVRALWAEILWERLHPDPMPLTSTGGLGR